MPNGPVSEPAQLFLGGAHPFANRIAEVVAGCPRLELGAGEWHYSESFPATKLLAVEQGFVVVRSTPDGHVRSIITSEAGPGRVLLPPTGEQALVSLTASRLVQITGDVRDRLFELPAAALALVELHEITVSQQQETLVNFAYTRHIERVRRKLLQLARSYGRVVRDGIRIDFPVSHTLLADMIGSSRETVTRALDQLDRSGFVARRGHTYRLLVAPEDVLGPDAA